MPPFLAAHPRRPHRNCLDTLYNFDRLFVNRFLRELRMRLTRSLLVALRVLAGARVIIGVGFWTGHWFGLRPVHMALGTLFVLVLWSLAITALVARRATGLAVFALIWGVVIAGFGASQQGLLIGDYHWI